MFWPDLASTSRFVGALFAAELSRPGGQLRAAETPLKRFLTVSAPLRKSETSIREPLLSRLANAISFGTSCE